MGNKKVFVLRHFLFLEADDTCHSFGTGGLLLTCTPKQTDRRLTVRRAGLETCRLAHLPMMEELGMVPGALTVDRAGPWLPALFTMITPCLSTTS